MLYSVEDSRALYARKMLAKLGLNTLADDVVKEYLYASRKVGGGVAVFAVVLYYTLRRNNPSVTLRQVVEMIRESGSRLTVSRALKMMHLLHARGALCVDDWKTLVEEISFRLGNYYNLSPLKLRMLLEEYLSRVRPHVGGRSRRNITAALAFIILRSLGFNVRYDVVADLCRVPESSLRKNVDLLELILLEVFDEKVFCYTSEKARTGDDLEVASKVPVDNPRVVEGAVQQGN